MTFFTKPGVSVIEYYEIWPMEVVGLDSYDEDIRYFQNKWSDDQYTATISEQIVKEIDEQIVKDLLALTSPSRDEESLPLWYAPAGLNRGTIPFMALDVTKEWPFVEEKKEEVVEKGSLAEALARLM